GARVGRPNPKAALRARVRASFEASGGTYGSESVTVDLRSGPGEPVSWRDLGEGDFSTPVVASEKVVRAIMAEEGLVARKAAQMRRRARYMCLIASRLRV
ncbi:MAG: transposase, partial [Atopobiaceae bacterium]|nr:transposase [Atopobiaceae bacterium]